MKRNIAITLAILTLVGSLSSAAFADDGEGLAPPRKGTPASVAYRAADAQYRKDDGNPAYHLQAIKVVDGSTVEDEMTVEVDFYSGEDGAYDYQVVLHKEGGKWVAGQVSSVS